MNADLETTRVVRAWLRSDERESADGVLADVLKRLDSTPQRHRLRSARSAFDVSAYAKLAIAIAAVIAVAVVGANRLPAGGAPGGSGAEISPSTQATETSRVDGLMVSGRQSVTLDGVRLSLDLPTLGWEIHDTYLSKSTAGPQGAEVIILWTNFPEVSKYIPCKDLLGQPEDRSMAEVAAAVSTVAGTNLVSGPSDVAVAGHAAKYVKFFVTYSVTENDLVCSPGFFFSWQANYRGAFWDNWIPGDTISVWIVDVDGNPLVIEAATRWKAGSALEREVQQIIDSIEFE